MKRALVLSACLLGGCAQHDDLETLRDQAIAITVYYQPILDQLVRRVHHLHDTFNGRLPGFYNALALANNADDTLGLWAFDDDVPPGPSWRPVANTLLGNREFVRTHVDDIVKQGDRAHLEHLVQDIQARYIRGIALVNEDLFSVESWLDAGTRAASEKR